MSVGDRPAVQGLHSVTSARFVVFPNVPIGHWNWDPVSVPGGQKLPLGQSSGVSVSVGQKYLPANADTR